jgi:hypothetical protein
VIGGHCVIAESMSDGNRDGSHQSGERRCQSPRALSTRPAVSRIPIQTGYTRIHRRAGT